MKVLEGTRKALIIGVSDYDNVTTLDFCKKDGEEMSKLLSSLGYEIVENNSLIGYVSSDKMKDAIIDFFSNKNINPDDTLVFYYSGHGVKNDQDGRVYLAPSEIDPDLPIKRGFSFDDLVTTIDNSISTRIIGILDCCYSGAAELSKGYEKNTAEIVTTIKEKSKEIEQGEGKCILAAGRYYQGSYPKEELDHSIFTYYLLEGLKGNAESVDSNGCVTPYTLNRYIYKKINSLPLEKRPQQKPVMKMEASGDIVLAQYRHLATRPDVRDPLSSPKTISRIDENNELSKLGDSLSNLDISKNGVCNLLGSLGYPLLPVREQLLDSNNLFGRKEFREAIIEVNKLVSQDSYLIHPLSEKRFRRKAAIVLVELVDEEILKSKLPFDITRYAVDNYFLTEQVIFFFIAPNARWLVVTAHTMMKKSPELTQVRRILIDLENITRTDLENMLPLKYSKEPDKMAESFRDALPYDKVGNKFFKDYHLLFRLFIIKLTAVLNGEEPYQYAQKLLGKIAFLYFLQKKGWLNGDKKYLKNTLEKQDPTEAFKSLYDLFNLLNTDTSERRSQAKIPYLNGSLFEMESSERIERISKACASSLSKVISIFDKYNFTISESTAFDKEVAVDPELLGGLFESMLPESERGDKGTFYTHQNEMLFMARESIRLYLISHFSDLLNHDQILFIVYNDKDVKDVDLSPRIARQIKEALVKIKILDPAVGSGGFLMTILQVLLEVKKRLNKIIDVSEPDYDMKLEIIRNNLFGIDIEHEAIELARLRLWLTLVVDEGSEDIRPLPNLDYNLHRGDSLKILESEKEHQEKLTVNRTIRDALFGHIRFTREQFMGCHGKDKQIKKNELEDLLKRLYELQTGSPPPKILPFSYKIFFADIMSQGGFDVVIMNPPYITQEEIGRIQHENEHYKEDIIEDIKNLTKNQFAPSKQSDISVYFLVRSLTLLKPKGISVVIATNKWLDVKYGIPLQEYLLTNTYLDLIFDSTERSFSADVNTAITLIRRPEDQEIVKQATKSNLTRFVYFSIPYGQVVSNLIKNLWSISTPAVQNNDKFRISVVPQFTLYSDGISTETDPLTENESITSSLGISDESLYKKRYVGTKWGNLHMHSPSFYFSILSKGKNRFRPLSEVCREVSRGPVTANNDYFILNEISRNKKKNLVRCKNGLGHEFYLESEFCPKILLRPPQDMNYEIENKKMKLRIFRCRKEKSQLRRTHALKYIEWAEGEPEAIVIVPQGREKGLRKRVPDLTTCQGRSPWYGIANVAPASILAPQAIKNHQVVYFSRKPIYFADRFYGIYTKDMGYITDLWLYFNSSVFRVFLELNGRTEGAGALSVKEYEYNRCPVLFPIPKFSTKFRLLNQFRKRSPNRIINISEEGPLELDQLDRKQLDDLVLKEIGFTDSAERAKIMTQLYAWLVDRVKERLTRQAPESLTKNIGKRKSNKVVSDFR